MNHQLHMIGQIETPYTLLEDCPNNIQPDGPHCSINLDEKYQDGLISLEPGQNIFILYCFENTDRSILQQNTKGGAETRGTFSLRSPHRPNPIGVAVLTIEEISVGKILAENCIA